MNEEAVSTADGPQVLSGPRPTPTAAAPLSNLQIALAAVVCVAALSVVIASLRMTDRAIDRAVAQREAAARFLQQELSVLRFMAMTSSSPVPARLYLGIEECFRGSVAMPFDAAEPVAARRTLTTCADMELGRLYAQGGARMASEGRALLQQVGLLP